MRRRTVLLLLATSCLTRTRSDDREPAPHDRPPPRSRRQPMSAAPNNALERRAKELRETYGERGLVVVVEEPFVVIGDEDPDTVEAHAKHTVRWAVDRLRAQFFADDPQQITDIWLFGSDEAYLVWAKELFDEVPDTPYGYYSTAHHALVMNIATGGGTLVHEIVHPFMAANFAACPAWFNEGLASLFEQSSEREGKIIGLTNWRLPALQQALRKHRVPSTLELTRTEDHAFYDDDHGTNYAQARYLCHWLQEHGVLEDFYREFVAAADKDPTGFATLSSVVGYPNMDEFDVQWRKFVLGLRFDS
jgi:hypothetical protein